MTPNASPHIAVTEKAMLVRTSNTTPASAAARPSRNVALGRSRQKSHIAAVTKSDARLASSVELATEVKRIDQCQKARSPAKAKPAAKSIGHAALGAREPSRASGHNSGAASATRQKALALGPTSALPTKMGESAIQVAPVSNAAKAGRMARRWYPRGYLRSFQRLSAAS